MQKITFNGKEYNTLDEMPPAERQAYEQLMAIFVDKDQNGIPDFLEGDLVRKILNASTATMIVNGQPVRSLETLSPEMRARYERGMKTLQALGILPEMTSRQPAPQEDAGFPIRPSPPLIPPTPIHQEDNGPRAVVLAAIVLVLILVMGGVALLLLAR